jgi:hypothetical protein
MRNRIPLLALAALAIAALGLSVTAQNDGQLEREMLREQLEKAAVVIETLIVGEADPDSANWRSLGPEVGLMLGREERGVVRATLYVRSGTGWTPVAVDGFAEIAPDNLLLRK